MKLALTCWQHAYTRWSPGLGGWEKKTFNELTSSPDLQLVQKIEHNHELRVLPLKVS